MRGLAAALLIAACPATAEPLSFEAFMARPIVPGGARLSYGSAPSQFVELSLPKGAGPFPVAVLLHGGCWIASLPGLEMMNGIAADLTAHGIAVWNVEYRRIDEAGGGYPGTFADVAEALDLLKAEAPKYHLDLGRVVAVGHSAGGHLGLWAAARDTIPVASPLRAATPLQLRAVFSLGGLPDLRNGRRQTEDSCGRVVDWLTGKASAQRPDVYADTSPAQMGRTATQSVLIHGRLDGIAPPSVGEAYAKVVRGKGGKAEFTVIEGAGHFELISPETDAWKLIAPRIAAALK